MNLQIGGVQKSDFMWMSYENGTSVAPLHQEVESEEELREERKREEDDRRASRTCAACAELCAIEAGCCVDPERERVLRSTLGCVSRSQRRESRNLGPTAAGEGRRLSHWAHK